MLLGLGSVGFRDRERRPGGVRKSAALGGASLSDSVGADLLRGERIPRGTETSSVKTSLHCKAHQQCLACDRLCVCQHHHTDSDVGKRHFIGAQKFRELFFLSIRKLKMQGGV